MAFTVDIGTAHIVTGCDIVSAQIFSGKLEEGFKFDLFVAQDIWVWRAARFVLFEEQFENVIPVFGSKVYRVQLNAELVTHRLRVGKIRRSRTVFLAVVFLPVLHEQALHLIALLQ